jgi:glycosyltransferase involved in cell wall biosynthesis
MHMKIAVYAPAKNEGKHAQAWADTTADADYRIVIDTGSKDSTKEILEKAGVTVRDVLIDPWRFDDAYNIAMSLVPTDADILICLHMDERLDKGWRELLEAAWTPETTRLRYTYIWSWNPDGSPGRTWAGDRIHARRGYRWMGATHEGLCARLPETQTSCMELRILHYPDPKAKSDRDLALLQEAVREMPHDARMRAYLAREYMYQSDNAKSTETYKEFLAMSQDRVERQLAMCSLSTTDPDNKVFWLKMAVIETPSHREPLLHLAQHYYEKADWSQCYEHAKDALKITVHPMDYTCNPEAWSWQPHDLLSIAAWNLRLYTESLEHAKLALEHWPTNDRLINNVKLIDNYIKENLTDTPKDVA